MGSRLTPVRSVLRPTDALLTHPWFVRIAGALTVAGVLNGLADRVFDFSTIPLIATLVGAFLLTLSGIAFAQRHYTAGDGEATKDPAAFLKRFSAWVTKQRASLPQYDAADEDVSIYRIHDDKLRAEYQAARLAAYDRLREKVREVERGARREYHDAYRADVLAIVGEGHAQADNPRTIEDLEAVEKLLRAAKPVRPEDAAAFKDFAHRFAGWFRGREIAGPVELTDPFWTEYREKQERDRETGAISAREYQHNMKPFTERSDWERAMQAEYQEHWRADVARQLEWARRSGAMKTGEDATALILVRNPIDISFMKTLVEAVERIAKGL